MNRLHTIDIAPEGTATHCVIWLHGLGADGHDFVDLIPQLKLPEEHRIRFIFPHAPLRPVTLNGNTTMRAWFDLYSLNRLDREDAQGLSDSEALIHHIIQEAMEDGVPAEHIALAGFSQGGAMALYTGLRYPQKLAGILALSAYLPQMTELGDAAHPSNQSTPIMIAHGSEDPIVPLTLGEKSRDKLKELDYQVDWHTYPMAHQVCAAEIDAISSWFSEIGLFNQP